ncbi:MAG: hypothetical protein K8823_1095 [Cenarchaeum symbiont of Oopsacas minuta]|nr:hypothetical protein [Cenarchaeum symbiont of Oopsacas minuta]
MFKAVICTDIEINLMPLDNYTIEKLNEMTTMIQDKSKLDESNIKYVKTVFSNIMNNDSCYDTLEIDSWLKGEGSWKNPAIRNRIVNLAHYVQSCHEQSDKFRMIKDVSCGCGDSC